MFACSVKSWVLLHYPIIVGFLIKKKPNIFSPPPFLIDCSSLSRCEAYWVFPHANISIGIFLVQVLHRQTSWLWSLTFPRDTIPQHIPCSSGFYSLPTFFSQWSPEPRLCIDRNYIIDIYNGSGLWSSEFFTWINCNFMQWSLPQREGSLMRDEEQHLPVGIRTNI